MPKVVTQQIERPCLGWCGKTIPSRDNGDRYCRKCRTVKEGRERSMSKMETCTYRTGVDVKPLLGE